MKGKLAIAASLALITMPAIAKPIVVEAPRTERVSYADLNLGSAVARTTLQNRIRAAGERVCDLGGMSTLKEFGEYSNCWHSAVKDGLRQMDELIARNRSGSTLAASTLTVSAK